MTNMTNTQHTPAPWVISERPNEANTLIIEGEPNDSNGGAINCRMYGKDRAANARLIAAAPAMRAALESIATMYL